MRRDLMSALIFGSAVVSAISANANETGLAGSHSWRIEGNKTCFEDHTHIGGADGRTKDAAVKAAVREWREFTAWEYGPVWASYRRASGKTVSYTKAERGWSARVEARPCRLKQRQTERAKKRVTAKAKRRHRSARLKPRQIKRVKARVRRAARRCGQSRKRPSYWC